MPLSVLLLAAETFLVPWTPAPASSACRGVRVCGARAVAPLDDSHDNAARPIPPPLPDTNDPFVLLGIDRSSAGDMGAIKSAFHRLAKAYHPDVAADESTPEPVKRRMHEDFSAINAAYEVLRNDDGLFGGAAVRDAAAHAGFAEEEDLPWYARPWYERGAGSRAAGSRAGPGPGPGPEFAPRPRRRPRPSNPASGGGGPGSHGFVGFMDWEQRTAAREQNTNGYAGPGAEWDTSGYVDAEWEEVDPFAESATTNATSAPADAAPRPSAADGTAAAEEEERPDRPPDEDEPVDPAGVPKRAPGPAGEAPVGSAPHSDELAAAGERCKSLERRLERAEQVVAATRREKEMLLAKLRAGVATHAEEMAAIGERCRSLQERLDWANGLAEGAKREREALDERVRRAEQLAEKAEGERTSLEGRLHSAEQQVASTKREKEHLEDMLQTMALKHMQEKAPLQGKIDSLEAEVSALRRPWYQQPPRAQGYRGR